MTSIGSNAFTNCTNLQCTAIMNENCTIENNTFTNTPLNTTYMNNMGPDATCL